MSRGRIISHNTTDNFDGMFKSWSFRVTSEMSPSARLIGYYIDSNERVVADSILLRIDDKLPTEVTRKGYGEMRAREDFFNICERVFIIWWIVRWLLVSRFFGWLRTAIFPNVLHRERNECLIHCNPLLIFLISVSCQPPYSFLWKLPLFNKPF